MNATNETKKSYTVIIEWNGQKPPSKWYRWREELVGRIRTGDNEIQSGALGLMEERRKGDAVNFQEGVIICKSRSLAETIADFVLSLTQATNAWGESLYKLDRPVVVFVGETTMTEVRSSDMLTQSGLDRLSNTLGRRGRKPKAKKWAVYCLECCQTFNTEAPKVVNCPSCSGVRVHARHGERYTWKDDGRNIFDLWSATRFFGSHLEQADINVDGDVAPPEDFEILSTREATAFRAMNASPELKAIVDKLDRDEALALLDAIATARSHYDAPTRQKARIVGATRFFEMGGSPTGVVLAESPTADLLDASLLLGEDYVATLLLEATTVKQ